MRLSLKNGWTQENPTSITLRKTSNVGIVVRLHPSRWEITVLFRGDYIIMKQNKFTGGCLCGSVRYSISEKPQRGCICHCRFCQKQTGTGARPAISVDKSSVEFSGTTIS
jgi:hypothetical protein